jgi:hypothetical protein
MSESSRPVFALKESTGEYVSRKNSANRIEGEPRVVDGFPGVFSPRGTYLVTSNILAKVN